MTSSPPFHSPGGSQRSRLLADFAAAGGTVKRVPPGSLRRLRIAGHTDAALRSRGLVVLLSDLSSGRRPSEPGQSGLIATGPDGAVVAAILVEAPTGPGGVYRVPDLAATGELRGAGTALMATVAQMAAQEPDGTVEVDAEVGAAGFYEVLGMQPTGKRPHTEVDEALCPMAWTHDQVVEMAALARGHGLTPPPPRPHGLHREL